MKEKPKEDIRNGSPKEIHKWDFDRNRDNHQEICHCELYWTPQWDHCADLAVRTNAQEAWWLTLEHCLLRVTWHSATESIWSMFLPPSSCQKENWSMICKLNFHHRDVWAPGLAQDAPHYIMTKPASVSSKRPVLPRGNCEAQAIRDLSSSQVTSESNITKHCFVLWTGPDVGDTLSVLTRTNISHIRRPCPQFLSKIVMGALKF